MLADEALSVTPVRLTAKIHHIIHTVLGVNNLYQAMKKDCNSQALKILPELYGFLDNSANRLEAATKIAIAGNVIDYGSTGESYNLEDTIRDSHKSSFGINDFDKFKKDVITANRILYVGDNAGEIAFDRLLIEEIKKVSDPEIIFVVRGKPILNDVTLEDARAVELTRIVDAISSGGDGPGCELDRGASEIRKYFEKADMVISKGQGNYEALSHEPYRIYFLLKIKCPIIGEDIGGCKGDSVVKLSRNVINPYSKK